MPALQDHALFADQRPHPLLATQGRAFLDPELRSFGGTAKGGEDRGILAELHRIILPMSGSDHAAVQIEDTVEFDAFEADLRRLAGKRKRCDDTHQARSRSASGACSASNASSRLRIDSSSQRMISIFCVAGSNMSLHGVP